MDSQTSGIPEGNWVKDIAFAVRDLIRQYGMARFREMVRQWAIDRDKVPVDSPAHALPLTRGSSPFADDESTPKTLAEKYACLAAIHDGICLEAERVDPWPRRASKSINEILCETKGDWKAALEIWSAGLVGTGYWQMIGIVKGGGLHGEQQPREGEDDLRRELLAVLEDVRADLAKAGVPASPIESAIAELLQRIPETWQVFCLDDLTDMQSEAQRLLVAAGLVERRGRDRLRMLNHQAMVEATWTATGEGGLEQALDKLCAAMWIEWQGAYDKWKQDHPNGPSAFLSESIGPSEWRLTADGVNARKNLAGDRQERRCVFDRVMRRGIFDGQPREIDGRLVQYGPVPGKGELLQMNKVTADAPATSTVNVGNWSEGAKVFTEALAAAFAAMQAKAQAPANPTPAKEDKPTDTNPDDGADRKAVHNADFTMVKWYGTEYTFALGVQSSAVKALWNEWEETGLGLHQETIRNAVDAERENFRMDTAFRGHRALGTMIGRSGDGRYRLCPPDAQASPTDSKQASPGITSKSRRKRV